MFVLITTISSICAKHSQTMSKCDLNSRTATDSVAVLLYCFGLKSLLWASLSQSLYDPFSTLCLKVYTKAHSHFLSCQTCQCPFINARGNEVKTASARVQGTAKQSPGEWSLKEISHLKGDALTNMCCYLGTQDWQENKRTVKIRERGNKRKQERESSSSTLRYPWINGMPLESIVTFTSCFL